MDVLDLFLLLFPRTAPCQCRDGGVHRRQLLGTLGGQPVVSSRRLGVFAVPCSGAEHCWVERREMASERGRRDDLHSLAAAGGSWRGGVAGLRVCHALYLGKYDASLELGNGEFLAADSF